MSTTAADNKQIKGWIRKVQIHMNRVAAERDKMDETITELSMLKESCDRAYDNLQSARDALSELV